MSDLSPSTPPAARPSPGLLRHGPRLCLALVALMVLAALPLGAAGWAAPIPPPVALLLRAPAFLLAGWGFAVLRRLEVLDREGLRLTGTITGYAQRPGDNGRTLFFPQVRIEDPPFAGRQFQGDDFRFPRDEHPVGSTHPALAHPARKAFALDRPERARQALWAVLLGTPFLFLLPEIGGLFAWL